MLRWGVRCDAGRGLRFGLETFVKDGAFETHTLDVAFDAERLEVELVVLDFDFADLLFELLVFETVLGCIALDGDGGRVRFGFGLDRLGGWSGCRHGCQCCLGDEVLFDGGGAGKQSARAIWLAEFKQQNVMIEKDASRM